MWIVCPPTFFLLLWTVWRRASEPKRSSEPWPHPIALAVNKSSRFLFLYARSCISKKKSDIEDLRTGFSFSLFHWKKKQNKTKQNKTKKQENRNTQKRWGDKAQKETIRLRPSPFYSFFIASIDFPDDFGSDGGMKNRKRKQKQKTTKKKKSEKRMPQTLASLPWSLKTTRHDHQIDTNSISRKLWWSIS